MGVGSYLVAHGTVHTDVICRGNKCIDIAVAHQIGAHAVRRDARVEPRLLCAEGGKSRALQIWPGFAAKDGQLFVSTLCLHQQITKGPVRKTMRQYAGTVR